MLESDRLEARDLQLAGGKGVSESVAIEFTDENLDSAMKKFESTILRRLYPSYPSTRQLAKKLGLSHTAVANKLREYGISKPSKRSIRS